MYPPLARPIRWFRLLGLLAVSCGWAQAPPSASDQALDLTLSTAFPVEGSELRVYFAGGSAGGSMRFLLSPADGGPEAAVAEAHAVGAEGFVRLHPPHEGTHVVRVIGDASGTVLAESEPFEVAPPTFHLSSSPEVEVGQPLRVLLSRPARAGDVLVFEGRPGTTRDAGGLDELTITAPAEAGSYRIHLLSGRTGEVLAEGWVDVVEGGSLGSCPNQADEASLIAAFEREADHARSLYGHLLGGARAAYSTTITEHGAGRASVEARYDLVGIDRQTGEDVALSGTVDAWFAWRACEWRLEGIDY